MCKIKPFILAVFCLLCFVGCGQQEAPITEENASNTQPVTWQTSGFAVSEEIRQEQGLWASEYIKWQHEAIDYDLTEGSVYIQEPGAYGTQIYRFYHIVNPNRYVLETYDTATMQSSVTEVDFEKLGMNVAFIMGMDVIGPEHYVFQTLEYNQEQSEQSNIYMVYSDLKEVMTKTDIQSLYEEKDIAQEAYRYECICDSAGNNYVRTGNTQYPFRDLYIWDREGNLLMEHKGDEGDEIRKPLQMSQGELIFPIYNRETKTTRMVWFDVENQSSKELAGFEAGSVLQVYGIVGEEIYYESHEGIVKWNITSGERGLIYDFDTNGVPSVYNTMLVLGEGQPPILRMYGTINDEEEDWLVVLSEQEVERPEAIQIVSLNGTSSNVKDCAAVASRRNPNYDYVYEGPTEAELEDFRTRIIAEMVAGKGPDILYVSLEDMEQLQVKRLLMDLETVLSEEVREQVLPGIIQLGTVDDTFVGLAPEMEIHTAVTSQSIWNEDTWSLADVITLLDSGEYTEIFCQGTTSFAPRALLLFFTEFGVQDNQLIDWEHGESHFESDLFLKILELAKTYGDVPIRTDTFLGTGGSIGEFTGGGIWVMNDLYKQYGNEYYFVGMPTTGDSGNYLTSEGVLVVNKNVTDMEAVAAYLECLLRDEIQYAYRSVPTLSVKKVLPEDIKFVETEDGTEAFWQQNALTIKEDGTTTLDDYMELVESCVPYPKQYEDIENIVWEEAQSYMTGDKNAKEVAQIIDNRVQLYLDEIR